MNIYRVKIFTIASLLFTFSFFFFSNIDVARISKKNSTQSKKNLFNTLFSEGAVGIYSTTNNEHSITNSKKKALGFGFRNLRITWFADTAISESLLKKNSLLVTGSFNDKFIKKILDRISIDADNNRINVSGKQFHGKQLSLHLVCPNPYNKNKLLILNAGDNNRFSSNRILSDLEILDGNKTIYLADLDYSNSIDSNLPVRNEFLLHNQPQNIIVANSIKVVDESGKIEESYLKQLGEKLTAANLNFSKTFKQKRSPNILVHVYDTFERKGLMINNTRFSNIIGDDVHILLNKDYPIYLNDYYKLLLKKNLGEGSCNFISDAVAAYLAMEAGNSNNYEIASRLIKANVVPSLKELSNDENYAYYSNYLIESIGALLVKFIIEQDGIEGLKNYYLSFDKALTELFQHKWEKHKNVFANNYPPETKNKKPIPLKLKGFCYAHEGYQIHNGYLSNSSLKSLKRLKELGTNAISITPFTGMREPNKVSRLPIWRSAGAENDESVIFCNKEANKLGMFTLLKPHIYLHRSWPGAIKFNSEDEWNLFFKHYTDWIIHYALLAQLNDIPVFVIGNELSEASLRFPDKMRELIKKIRIIFDGYITYGANWGNEFENITFWDDLDFIGLSEYYPLSKNETFDEAELNKGINEVINKIDLVSAKFAKKVILTEIGFRSSKSPWMTSFEPEESRKTFNSNSQALVYKLALPRILNDNNIIGLFIWKWPTYLEYNVNQNRDMYTPLKKKAEYIIQTIFNKL